MANLITKQLKKETILVALDNSLTSRTAARMAIQVARSQGLMIQGLFVVDSQLVDHPSSDYQSELGNLQGTLSRPSLIIRLEEMGNQALAKLEAECREAGVVVITEIVFGNVAETIQQKADRSILLALGRRGHGQPADTNFLGQHFRAICHTVRKPILVGGEEKAILRRILVAAPDEDLIQRSTSYLPLLQNSLIGETVLPISQEGLHQSSQKASSNSSSILPEADAFIPIVGKTSEEIAAQAIQKKADLVILAGYPPKNPLRWLVGSFTEQVIRGVQAPVLIIYDPISL